jgi:hypothetical protein
LTFTEAFDKRTFEYIFGNYLKLKLMTRRTNAKVAGFTFLLYIAVGITSLVLSSRVTGDAGDTATKLAGIAHHSSITQATVLLTLIMAGCALVLGVTLYALTRDSDRDLALMALCCRAGEGLIAVLAPVGTLLLWSVATTSQSNEANNASWNAFGEIVLKTEGWTSIITATCFAVGSTIFCYLFLRGRSIPAWLSWFGLIASILLVVVLPLHLVGLIQGLLSKLIWLPMLLFELSFALWLLIKGAPLPVIPVNGTNDQKRI